MEPIKIIKTVRLRIWATIAFMIFYSAQILYNQLINDQLTLVSFISLGVAVFIVYSLLLAKEWARNYIIAAILIVLLFSLFSLFHDIRTGIWGGVAWKSLMIIWMIYFVRFIAISELYEKYIKLIRSGASHEIDKIIPLEEIIPTNQITAVDYREFNSITDYSRLAEQLFNTNSIGNKIESITTENTEINIELAEEILNIEVDLSTPFFKPSFIEDLNLFIPRIHEDGYEFHVIFPDTTLKKRQKALCLIDEQTKDKLILNGYLEK